LCRDEIRNCGLENTTVNQLFSNVEKSARDCVPNDIKAELIESVLTLALHWPSEQSKYGLTPSTEKDKL